MDGGGTVNLEELKAALRQKVLKKGGEKVDSPPMRRPPKKGSKESREANKTVSQKDLLAASRSEASESERDSSPAPHRPARPPPPKKTNR